MAGPTTMKPPRDSFVPALKPKASSAGMLTGSNGLRKQSSYISLAEAVLTMSEKPKIHYDKCKVIATVGGPLTKTVEQLADLLRAGMTVARFDFQQGSISLAEHQRTLENLKAAGKLTSCMCAVYCSLGGNVFAVSKRDESVSFKFTAGQVVRLIHGDPVCDSSDVLPVGAGILDLDFMNSFAVGDSVTINPYLQAGDQTAELTVETVTQNEVTCRVLNDVMEFPGNRATVHFTHTKNPNCTLVNARDEEIIRQWAVPAKVDFISFGAIRSGATIRTIKDLVKSKYGLPHARIMARIDNLSALRDLPNILKEADVILLARGELGAVVEAEKMFAVQKHVLRMCEVVGRPCIVTRLMDSMISAPRPTRAEATDIANIVLDGADGLLLGLETLEGMFPLQCLETALAIAREADSVYDYESRYRRQMQVVNVKLAKATEGKLEDGYGGGGVGGGGGAAGAGSSPGEGGKIAPRARSASLRVQAKDLESVEGDLKKEALAAAAVQTAYQINAKLIVVFSHTGETTRLVAKYHPQCPVLSISIPTVHGGTLGWVVEGDVEARQQLVIRGVVPALSAGHAMLPDEGELGYHLLKERDDGYGGGQGPHVGATRTDIEGMTKAAELGLIQPGELAVFCQLIAGQSTVKVVEFAGLNNQKTASWKTFSPSEPRSRSPALPHAGGGGANATANGGLMRQGSGLGAANHFGHVGTVPNLAALNIVEVAEVMAASGGSSPFGSTASLVRAPTGSKPGSFSNGINGL